MSDLTKLAEPVAWRWHDPSDGWRGQWYAMSVKGRFASDEEPPWEMEYAYLAPPNLAAELAEAQRLVEFWKKSSGEWRDGYVRLQEELAEPKKELFAAREAEREAGVRCVTHAARAEKAEAALAKIESICTACVNRSGHIVTVLNNIEAVIRGANE